MLQGVNMSERSLKTSGDLGPLIIVKPKALAAAGTTGVVAEGIYEGAVKKPAGVSKNGKAYKASTEFRVRGEGNTLYILNETRALTDQLSQLTADGSEQVKIVYNGCKNLKNGSTFHDFEVFLK